VEKSSLSNTLFAEPNKEEIYFSFERVLMYREETPCEGDEVEFSIEQDKKGREQAALILYRPKGTFCSTRTCY